MTRRRRIFKENREKSEKKDLKTKKYVLLNVVEKTSTEHQCSLVTRLIPDKWRFSRVHLQGLKGNCILIMLTIKNSRMVGTIPEDICGSMRSEV